MIEELKLVNFQKHKDLKIQFQSGVNSIIGRSDSGKSAIIRALNSVINNQIKNEYITNGQKQTEIELTYNNNKIKRVKSENKNEYYINGEKLEAFGQSVPDAVENLFNFSYINLQSQHDSYFLLSDTSGEVSRKLNDLIDLSIIQKSLSECDSRKRDTIKNIKYIENDLTELNKKIEKLNWIKKAEKLVSKLTELENNENSKIEQIKKLSTLLSDVEFNQNILIGVKNKISNFNKIKPVLNKLEKLKNDEYFKLDKLNNLLSLFNDLRHTKEKLDNFKDLKNQKEKLLKLSTLFKTYKEKSNSYNLLENIFDSVNNLNLKLREVKDDIRKNKKELSNIMPEVCPFCGQKIKEVKK